MKVYGLSGGLVRNLASLDVANGGLYSLLWDGKNGEGGALASGVYFISIHGKSTAIPPGRWCRCCAEPDPAFAAIPLGAPAACAGPLALAAAPGRAARMAPCRRNYSIR